MTEFAEFGVFREICGRNSQADASKETIGASVVMSIIAWSSSWGANLFESLMFSISDMPIAGLLVDTVLSPLVVGV